MIPLLIYGEAGFLGAVVYVALSGWKHYRKLAVGPIAGLFIFFISPNGSALDLTIVAGLGFFLCCLPRIGKEIAKMRRMHQRVSR